MLNVLVGAYPAFLFIHSLVRWLLIASALYAVGRALAGWFGKREWVKADDTAGILFTSLFDLQVLMGLLLYFLNSPIVASAWRNIGAAMQVKDLRFFGVEHVLLMLVAMIVAHVGRTLAKKQVHALKKHRTAAVWFVISILIVLAAIPWWRPLLGI